MPTAPREIVLCRYHYDPLDRLTDCAPSAEARTQRFYCKSRLATEIQGAVQHSVFQHDDQLLAQLRREDARGDTTLLATDQQRSVLNALDATRPHPLAYTPYGHRPAENGLLSLLGFNGERPDPVTGHYLLGNGYRAFNPVLMRFNSPDSLSPFGEGGLNAYAYCGGDPRNKMDQTGHIGIFSRIFSGIFSSIGQNLTPVEKILKGAKVKFGKEILVPRLPETSGPSIQLSKYSSDEIAGLSNELNIHNSAIYDQVISKIYHPIDAPMSAQSSQTIADINELLSNHKIIDYQNPPGSRVANIHHLVDSIKLHRNLIEAQAKAQHLPAFRTSKLASQRQTIRR
ncbi:RHS repeat-associated core domain-containing protein [Pseudomonas sp. NFACC23-1]|uniref:RHS repeat-associated core domain-containing protein n=1 Tax=unclassified Pseudomonas TaxID=196821 RepID=UPI0008827104|nr:MULTISPECIES: RHS repeat-associated core domain-containing protein [unclassified Pseudomonas]SDB47332.1 RHS repeat-associated core domain-containing protein [Pseudomonas sp. NFACC17-2]SEJ99154.1 RHS repeat-associated core domain-containing protein [Pseudomonas sp. NFACC23-1]SFW50867.1 RHS repeat-associated core domain-containing protein [Pseudomonas sp. NFACC16-2]